MHHLNSKLKFKILLFIRLESIIYKSFKSGAEICYYFSTIFCLGKLLRYLSSINVYSYLYVYEQMK